jgi:PTH1 family peptidyl-tRNA hydrolase
MDPLLLVFGLGNPGKEYETTYHNAGILALGALQSMSSDERSAERKKEKHFEYRKHGGIIFAAAARGGELFMNESGIPVEEALAYFKIPPGRLVLLHDDSDLPIGTYKLEKNRGAAGHHGVESVIAKIGRQDFWRGRIGIRPAEPEDRRRKAEEFVLKTISAEDMALLEAEFGPLGKDILALQHSEISTESP